MDGMDAQFEAELDAVVTEAAAVEDTPVVEEDADSPAEEDGTPKDTPKTFTQDEVDGLLQAERQRQGGIQKKLNTAEAEVEASKTRLTGLLDEIKELEAGEKSGWARDPEGTDLVSQKQELRRLRRELADERATLSKDRAGLDSILKEGEVAAKTNVMLLIAHDAGVSPKDLQAKLDELEMVDPSEKQLEAIAKMIKPVSKKKVEEDEEEDTSPEKPGKKKAPDSGINQGSRGKKKEADMDYGDLEKELGYVK